MNISDTVKKLNSQTTMSVEEYKLLVDSYSPKLAQELAEAADRVRRSIYGNTVYTRGLIEFTNICKNNCLYCGIRAENGHVDRYRLSDEEIMACVHEGYNLGFRTIVLQGGEDLYYTDQHICSIIRSIKEAYPDIAVTLSIGEKSRASYQAYYDAGRDRYLLRHETYDRDHYEKLHPADMSFENRIRCLHDLKEIGYQVGCGFMVGSPYQTSQTLAQDLKFIEEFQPDMCGIGPFIPQQDTPFGDREPGSGEMTCYLLSIIRLIRPSILLPATTALGTIDPMGREKGISAGANVLMPNLSPTEVRKKYALYDNKICTGDESAQGRSELGRRMESIGYKLVVDRGDRKEL